MRYWKAYGVGKGEWFGSGATLSLNIPKLNVLEAFSSECLNTGVMAAIYKCTDEKNCDVTVEGRVSFDCPIDGCICTYESHAGLPKHLDIGNHVRRLHRESQFDHIKGQYADMISDELTKSLFSTNYKSTSAEHNRQSTTKVTMGCALKKQKSSSRFPVKVEAYLNDRFLIVEQSGNASCA